MRCNSLTYAWYLFSLNLRSTPIHEFQSRKSYRKSKNKLCSLSMITSKILFSFNNNREIPFPLRYLQACINFELRNYKDSLSQFYSLLRDLETTSGNNSSAQFKRTKSKEGNGESRAKEQLEKILESESHELFGMFPPREAFDSKIIMASFEIVRVHQRQQDYRNAYFSMNKITKRYPKNPYVLSRMGRLCLESGRKQEALEYFNQIHKIMKSTAIKLIDSPLTSSDE